MSYKSHREIIIALGMKFDYSGSTNRKLHALASVYDTKYETVKGWWRRDSIPVGHWGKTIEIAKNRGLSNVTLEVLNDLRRSRNTNDSLVHA